MWSINCLPPSSEMLNLIPSSSDRQQSDYIQLINIDQSSTTLLDSSDDSNDAGKTTFKFGSLCYIKCMRI